MSNQVAVQKSRDLKQFFDRPAVQAKIRELVDKNSASFATSIMQIANSNPMLLDADPTSILNAACMAATLNLPINNSLGFAYIVPYRNKGKTEAQFQLGYKGFIQLAQRSGQFERLVSLPVYQNQLTAKDPINGFKFDWEQEPAVSTHSRPKAAGASAETLAQQGLHRPVSLRFHQKHMALL